MDISTHAECGRRLVLHQLMRTYKALILHGYPKEKAVEILRNTYKLTNTELEVITDG